MNGTQLGAGYRGFWSWRYALSAAGLVADAAGGHSVWRSLGFASQIGCQNPGEHSLKLGTPGLYYGRPLAFKTRMSVCYASLNKLPDSGFLLRPGWKDKKAGTTKRALAGFRSGAIRGFRNGLKPELRTQKSRPSYSGGQACWWTWCVAKSWVGFPVGGVMTQGSTRQGSAPPGLDDATPLMLKKADEGDHNSTMPRLN